MRCEQAREALIEARYEGSAGETAALDEASAHVRECESCRAWQTRDAALDSLLASHTAVTAGPDFDARFFARVAAERQAQRKRRAMRVLMVLAPLAAAAALVLALRPQQLASKTEVPAEELALAMDLELVQELEVVRKLDDVEDYDLLAEVDDADLAKPQGEAQ